LTSELNKKLKQTSNKKINSFLTIVLFLLIAGFLFFGNSKSSQAAGTCTCGIQKTDQYITTTNTKEECIAVCGGKNPTGFGYAGYNWKDDATGKNEGNAPIDIGKITNSSPIKDNTQVCSGATDWISHPINCSLLSVLKAEGIILSASSRLFQYILDPAKFLKIATHQIVYETWKIVRDLLNVAFIMALLFSAFCTIFQVEKYNYKKILLNLIIMALLVNFSFPITRFIIDVSNIMMYSLIKGLQIPVASNGEIFGKIAEGSLIQHIIAPGQPGSVDTSYLIIGVIFIFILLITLLTIAALMVVRVIALTILIIFSPVAFVGSLLSVGSKYTGQWWDNLFKYAFFSCRS